MQTNNEITMEVWWIEKKKTMYKLNADEAWVWEVSYKLEGRIYSVFTNVIFLVSIHVH